MLLFWVGKQWAGFMSITSCFGFPPECVLIQAKIVSELSCIWLCFLGVCKMQSHRMLPLNLRNKMAHLISWELGEIMLLLVSIVLRSLLAYVLGRCCLQWVCVRAHTRTNKTFILRGNFISFLVTCPLIFHSSGLTNTENFLS